MAEKYLYGSLIAAGIWAFAGMFFGDGAISLLFILATGIFFVILCYIIGLLKDISAKLGIREIGSEEKFFFEAEKEQNSDVAASETDSSKEDSGK